MPFVSDFTRIRVQDMDTSVSYEFPLEDFHRHVELFGGLIGDKKAVLADRAPVNIKAVKRLAALHDNLEACGYTGHALEIYLIRILFCLFAEDTGIFERAQFESYVRNHTNVDGQDLSANLNEIFDVLNQEDASLLPRLGRLSKAWGDTPWRRN